MGGEEGEIEGFAGEGVKVETFYCWRWAETRGG